MHAGKYLPGLIAALAALPAHAQQATPTPTPAPIPPPTITTLPGVIPERFSIAPSRPAATPTATATPTPTPAPAATQAPRAAAPAPVQRAPAQAARPVPGPVATPTASATAAPLPEAAPVQPQIIATPPPASVPAEPAPQPWFWALVGAGATAAVGLAGWLLLRRRRPEEEQPVVPEASAPSPPAPPVRGPSPARVAPQTAPVSADPFNIAVQPLRIHFGEREIVIEIELLVSNATEAAADAVRLAVAAISASPRQDAEIAAFHAGSQLAPSTAPFDLPAGEGGRMPVQLSLPREAVHVVDVGGRPMFVPIVAIDLRWRAGLSIRRFATSFMLGAAGQGGKLGPIWLDRGQPRGPFAASRYIARAAAA